MQNFPLEKLVLIGSETSPAINFDSYTGILEISGRSLQSDVQDFFIKIIDVIIFSYFYMNHIKYKNNKS